MFLVGHASVGIALATAVGATNPVAAFGVGWVSHYLADFFPHGDEDVGAWAKKGDEVRRLLGIVAIDGLVALGAFAVYCAHQGFTLWAASAAVGSFVPDVMWGLEKLLGRPLFGTWFERYHTWNHNLMKIHLPAWSGLPLQLGVAALIWWRLTVA